MGDGRLAVFVGGSGSIEEVPMRFGFAQQPTARAKCLYCRGFRWEEPSQPARWTNHGTAPNEVGACKVGRAKPTEPERGTRVSRNRSSASY
jgi:hypothetical protein